MTQKGFTLIELLVVIVIIGILATISVATFSGYFAKARDTERKTFTSAARTAIQAEALTNANGQTNNFCFGATTMAGVETAVGTFLDANGIALPADFGTGTNVAYYVAANDCTGGASATYAVVTCLEDGGFQSAGTEDVSAAVCDANGALTGLTAANVVALDY